MTWPTLSLAICLALVLIWNWRLFQRRVRDSDVIHAQAQLIDELQNARRSQGVLLGERNKLPIDIADASMVIAVIDRVPDAEDIFDNEDTPFVWMHPRLQKSWSLKRTMTDEQFWQETTPSAPNGGELHMVGCTPNDVFVTAMAYYATGCNDLIKVITHSEDVSDQNEAIRKLPIAICRAMDTAHGGSLNQWARIHGGISGPVAVVPEHVRRPINLDD